ncbi:MAG: ATP-dependent Clp protease adaptor ClpS [Bacteroidales bacterium]|jgi:ATP-dependent Clp protease adaptor protein ClpS|nr:ATP-dependent Clp protease adaptor ClpS [Bacteroidales bacterium]
MSISNNIIEPQAKEDLKTSKYNSLILYNDSKNTFDHVISCLVDICNHDVIQAEQCAYIANYKGRCDIKKGEYKFLKELKDALIKNGLIVTIE